ncbi:helix-turn-helix domain-containing protein [Thermogemmatispora carboxidivorans]|uniref:helix-turn-helix domain-containing protein n=1 Tax=Thermogemmatispora carboxidivorans TaxID=1382306 RepID=UPI00069C5D8F|nr:helix-turn-helix transcriptional regulator [Thermogemmatispora carboxidivorans]
MLRLRVKEVAQEKKISMHRLSMVAEISYYIIRGICADPYKTISTYTLNRIAEALEVPVTALVEDVPREQAEAERRQLKRRAAGGKASSR